MSLAVSLLPFVKSPKGCYDSATPQFCDPLQMFVTFMTTPRIGSKIRGRLRASVFNLATTWANRSLCNALAWRRCSRSASTYRKSRKPKRRMTQTGRSLQPFWRARKPLSGPVSHLLPGVGFKRSPSTVYDWALGQGRPKCRIDKTSPAPGRV